MNFLLRLLTFIIFVLVPVCACSVVVGFTLGTLIAGVVLGLGR